MTFFLKGKIWSWKCQFALHRIPLLYEISFVIFLAYGHVEMKQVDYAPVFNFILTQT